MVVDQTVVERPVALMATVTEAQGAEKQVDAEGVGLGALVVRMAGPSGTRRLASLAPLWSR